MKKTVCLTAALSLAFAMSGCGRDSYESVRKQQTQTIRDAVAVLATVKDSPSAEAARPKMKKLGERWRGLQKRFDALPADGRNPSNRKQLDDEFNAAVIDYVKESLRVVFVPGGKAALDEVGELKSGK